MKMEWEFGEQYGNVLFPEDLSDVQNKIDELDTWGQERDYPFLVQLSFTDESLYLAFTVGHDYSFIEFSYDVDKERGRWQGPFYLKNVLGDSDEIIPIYYMSSYTEIDTTKMMPRDKVLAAIYHFIQHQIFPAYIQFDDTSVNRRFVSSY